MNSQQYEEESNGLNFERIGTDFLSSFPELGSAQNVMRPFFTSGMFGSLNMEMKAGRRDGGSLWKGVVVYG